MIVRWVDWRLTKFNYFHPEFYFVQLIKSVHAGEKENYIVEVILNLNEKFSEEHMNMNN